MTGIVVKHIVTNVGNAIISLAMSYFCRNIDNQDIACVEMLTMLKGELASISKSLKTIVNSDVVNAIHRFTVAFDEYDQGNYELA